MAAFCKYFTPFSRLARRILNPNGHRTQAQGWSTSSTNKSIRSPLIRTSQGPATPLSHILVTASLFSFLSPKKNDDETPENNMVTTIKRSILAIQRGNYDQAEQMLHIALKLAQEMQHKDGITFIYDVMANLAMEKGDFVKAEKLFVSVMQRLFGDGYAEDSLKMLHMSAKMAHLAHLQEHLDKAMQGFQWTLEKLEHQIKVATESDEDLIELWGLTKNWYAQALMDRDRFAEAKKCFQEAYTVYTKINGRVNEEALMMLNNLSVACTNLNDFAMAEAYLQEAIELAKQMPELVDSGIFQVNLGLLYLQQGLLARAKDSCTLAWKVGTKMKSQETIHQANYCLDQIKLMTK